MAAAPLYMHATPSVSPSSRFAAGGSGSQYTSTSVPAKASPMSAGSNPGRPYRSADRTTSVFLLSGSTTFAARFISAPSSRIVE